MNKIYLDRLHLEALEYLAAEAGMIDLTKTDAGGLLPTAPPKPRSDIRRSVLLLATLFEAVDSDHSTFDCSRLVESGLVAPNARMLDHSADRGTPGDLAAQGDQIAKAAIKLSREIAIAFRTQIIMRHVQLNASFYRRKDRYSVKQGDLFREFDFCLENIDTAKHIAVKPHLDKFHMDLTRTVWNLEECLHLSMSENAAMAQVFATPGVAARTAADDLKDIYCVAEARFTSDVLLLPHPRSLSEAVELRNRKEMRRFRRLLIEWCEAVREGNPAIEARIRRDVETANRELSRLSRWREVRDGSLYFWVNSVGGHVPILSNILTVVATVGGLYEEWVARRHGWLMLGPSMKQGK